MALLIEKKWQNDIISNTNTCKCDAINSNIDTYNTCMLLIVTIIECIINSLPYSPPLPLVLSFESRSLQLSAAASYITVCGGGA